MSNEIDRIILISANILTAQAQKKSSEKQAEKSSEKTVSSNTNGHTQTISGNKYVNKGASIGSHKVIKEKSDPYECPNTSDFTFFPQYCTNHTDCIAQGRELRCCRQFNSKRCVKGVPKPLKEQRHERKLICISFSPGLRHLNYNCNLRLMRNYLWIDFQLFLASYRANVRRNHWPNYFGNWKRVTPITIVGLASVVLIAVKNIAEHQDPNWTLCRPDVKLLTVREMNDSIFPASAML